MRPVTGRTAAARAPVIPPELLPADGRFGSGPSKAPLAPLATLAATGGLLVGTSHRQQPVRDLVHRIRSGLAALFSLPDGYEVVLGNGGATAFFDVAVHCLVAERAQHLSFGEFGAKFAAETAEAPFLQPPSVRTAPAGTRTDPFAEPGVDTYCWAHNETSTGVMAPVHRVPGADDGALVVIDGTSAAGGLPLTAADCDAYFFAPQKNLAADGGLWLALLSPAAVERAARLGAAGRWVPAFLDLTAAVRESRLDQTVNTPSIVGLYLLATEVEALLERGGLGWASARTAESAALVYGWAERSEWAEPFVRDPAHRSQVVATVDFAAEVDAAGLAAALRANGVVDTESYRKLGRNQLRIAMFPAIEPADLAALTRCIDYLVPRLS
jgi:phosphoserine aminotransferase